jgi:murein DD-endopeptidase MepM/ murein hydrolase activator NlpD
MALGLGIGAVWIHFRRSAEAHPAPHAKAALQPAKHLEPPRITYRKARIRRGATFASVLEGLGASPSAASQLTACAQPVFNLHHLMAGRSVAVGLSATGAIRSVRYRVDRTRILSIVKNGNRFQAQVKPIPSRVQVVVAAGEVRSSLFEAVAQAGEEPALALGLAQIFRYDLDFNTETRPGDTFRLLVEKKVSLSGHLLGYGSILAAKYVNAGKNYEAVLFQSSSGQSVYYSPNGKPLRKAFLRSPLPFAAPITSGFSYHRFHPILKIYRPHLGVDYGAPLGTPVEAVANGRVVFAGWRGEAGKAICLQHARGYRTYYFHLSRILVRAGQRVVQGQRIGLVGETGLATGPHLDFRIQHDGVFLNFARLRLPRAAPVAKSQWAHFAAVRNHLLAMMDEPPELVGPGQRSPNVARAE